MDRAADRVAHRPFTFITPWEIITRGENVEIRYRSRHLQECASQEKEAIKAWGPEVGRRYVERLGTVRTAEKLADLYSFQQLRFHPLKANLASYYSITLTGRWRIIVTSPDETTVIIEEVSNHYDD